MKIAIIVGSTRPGRAGSAVGAWVKEQADARGGQATYDLLELADFELDLLNEPTVPGAANREYENPKTREWSKVIDSYDGFVFVTPEYNHGVPAALKNAVDVLYPEWNHKAITFVGYGAASGVRSVEHWRQIVANAMMQATRAQLELSVFTDFGENGFAPSERREGELKTALDQLEALTGAVKQLRG
ncbi:MAG: NADPH-dependent FMN reductase [Nocardioides sp.]|jgi:NAD(P)H-dependent FMN reductase